MYLLAIFVPPIAVFWSGRPFQAVFNLVLWVFMFTTFFGLIIPIVHALLVTNDYKRKKQARENAEFMAQAMAMNNQYLFHSMQANGHNPNGYGYRKPVYQEPQDEKIGHH